MTGFAIANRFVLLPFAALALAGCLNWQAGYDNAARADCRDLVNVDERRSCLDRVDENSMARRVPPPRS